MPWNGHTRHRFHDAVLAARAKIHGYSHPSQKRTSHRRLGKRSRRESAGGAFGISHCRARAKSVAAASLDGRAAPLPPTIGAGMPRQSAPDKRFLYGNAQKCWRRRWGADSATRRFLYRRALAEGARFACLLEARRHGDVAAPASLAPKLVAGRDFSYGMAQCDISGPVFGCSETLPENGDFANIGFDEPVGVKGQLITSVDLSSPHRESPSRR